MSGTDIDKEYFKLVLKTCRYIYIFISSIAVLLMMTLGLYYIRSLDANITTIIAWIIYTLGVYFNTLYSYYTSFLRGVGAIAENNKAGVFAKIIQISLSGILLARGMGLIGISIAYVVSGVSLRIISKYYFQNYEGIKNILANTILDDAIHKCWNLYKIIWHNASRDGLVTISNYLSTQANTLICSSLLGLSSTGSYGLFIQIATVASTLSGIPFTTHHPAMQEMALKKNYNESSRIFSTSMILYAMLFFIITIAVLLGMPVLKYLKESLEINNVMFLTIMLQMFVYQMYTHSASYISTFNIIPYTKGFIISSIVSVIISYYLASTTSLGVWSLIITPLAVSLLYNAWKWPLEALRISHSSWRNFMITGWYGSLKYLQSILKIK